MTDRPRATGDPGPAASSAGPPPPLSSGRHPSQTSATSPENWNPAPPPECAEAAQAIFAKQLPVAEAYARLLVTEGVVRGLIGPREAPRVWERHLLNCGVISSLISTGASIVDVGSGAGLPGIVLAVARPDLRITLVEPLARRTAFLSEAVAALGLDSTVTVVRGRAEDLGGGHHPAADVVTARAVAPLDRLAAWCLPLAAVGGRLLALKGASAGTEVAEHREAILRLGGSDPTIRLCGVGMIEPPATVVEVVRQRVVVTPRPRPSGRTAGSGRRAGASGGRGSERGRTRRG